MPPLRPRPLCAMAGDRAGADAVRVTISTDGFAPVDLARSLAVLRHGPGDPTFHLDGAGGVWRTCATPEGAATLHATASPRPQRRCDAGEGHTLTVSAWGDGASWVLARAAELVGARDAGLDLAPSHPRLRDATRRYRGVRLVRTGLVLDSLVPAILEQKVTAGEAHRSWRELVLRHGRPAPGPAPARMRVAPDAAAWALVPSWEWHRAGVGPQRAAAIVGAARAARPLESGVDLGSAVLDQRLRSLTGIGVWTSAEVRQRVLGDPDAVSVGDYHLPALVGWTLAGERSDDAGMLRLLEPWRGQRYRVTRLVELSGARVPRHGPRFAPRDYRGL